MKLLGWIVVVAVAVVAVFAAANWSLLAGSTSLNLLAMNVEGPLGFVLLGAALLFAALFAVYALSLQTPAMLEMRRNVKQLDGQQQAEQAEISRITMLGSQVEQEFASLRGMLADLREAAEQRAAGPEQTLMTSHSENGRLH